MANHLPNQIRPLDLEHRETVTAKTPWSNARACANLLHRRNVFHLRHGRYPSSIEELALDCGKPIRTLYRWQAAAKIAIGAK
jgi:hypothetical protein